MVLIQGTRGVRQAKCSPSTALWEFIVSSRGCRMEWRGRSATRAKRSAGRLSGRSSRLSQGSGATRPPRRQTSLFCRGFAVRWPGGRPRPAIELLEVVGGGDQLPFAGARGDPAPHEPADAAVSP